MVEFDGKTAPDKMDFEINWPDGVGLTYANDSYVSGPMGPSQMATLSFVADIVSVKSDEFELVDTEDSVATYRRVDGGLKSEVQRQGVARIAMSVDAAIRLASAITKQYGDVENGGDE